MVERPLIARRVVVAVGSNYFQHVPPSLAHLPTALRTTAPNIIPSPVRGTRVTVVGGGASALDLVALLHEIAPKFVSSHGSRLSHFFRAGPQILWHRIALNPLSGIGCGWRSRFFSDAPIAISILAAADSSADHKDLSRSAGAWFVQRPIDGQVPFSSTRTPAYSESETNGFYLQCEGDGGNRN